MFWSIISLILCVMFAAIGAVLWWMARRTLDEVIEQRQAAREQVEDEFWRMLKSVNTAHKKLRECQCFSTWDFWRTAPGVYHAIGLTNSGRRKVALGPTLPEAVERLIRS